jgi:NAD(P)-dependent dehydrogenase (short-subunit alcohol dehydrogenase family)
MAEIGRSLAQRAGRWNVLLGNATEEMEAEPRLQRDLEELRQILAETRRLLAQQADLQAQARQVTARLRETAKRGDRVRGRIGANLRWRFGFGDVLLVKFGFRPRPERIRKSPEPPAPTAAQENPEPGA